MKDFILVTYLAEGDINQDLLSKSYSDNYINIDGIDNNIKGYPDSLHYMVDGKIYSYIYRSKRGIENIYRIYLTYPISKAETIKEYISVCLYLNCDYIRRGDRVLFEINVKGMYKLITYLYFFIFNLNNIINGGELYCIRTFDKQRVGKLKIRDFVVTDEYFNNLDIDRGYSYISLLFPYKRYIKESLIEYLRNKEEKVINMSREETSLFFSSSRPDFSSGNTSPNVVDLLVPGALKEIIDIITYQSDSIENYMEEEIGKKSYKRLKEYISEVEQNSDNLYRKPIPFYEGVDQEIAIEGINTSRLKRRYNSPEFIKENAEDISSRVKEKGNEERETLDINYIIECKEKGKLKIDKKTTYKINREGIEYEVYVYDISKYPKDIEGYLDANLLISEYDLDNIKEVKYTMCDEEKLQILEKHLMVNNKD